MKKKQKTMADIAEIVPKEFLMQGIGEMYDNGLPRGLSSGIKELDDVCRLDTGRVCVVTGIPNDGKSEFVDFLTVTYNKRYGFKTIFFSPENQPYPFHLSKLISKYTNQPFDKSRISEEDMKNTASYVCDNFFFFNYQKVSTSEQILNLASTLISEHEAKILVIDAFNKVECEKSGEEDSLIFISRFLDRLCKFAIEKDILVFLVAHPRKMDWGKESKRIPSPYDINGSANFFNKSDFVLSVQRNRRNDSDTSVTIEVGKVKFKNYGAQGRVLLNYDVASGNYYFEGTDSWEDSDDLPAGFTPIPFTIPTCPEQHEPLDVEVSLYKGATDNVGTIINLKDFLFSEDYKAIADDIRRGNTPEERKTRKSKYKNTLPCVTICGRFTKRDTKHLEEYSGLMGIDIDLTDNQEIMSKVPSILKGLDYITYFGKSISGDGYFAICKIANPKKIKEHFMAIERDMKQLGITIDTACKDITRLRFASYDENAYYNPNASTYLSVLENTRKQMPNYKFVSSTTNSFSSSERVEQHIDILRTNGLSLPDDYQTWFKVGMALSSEFGEGGRQYYHSISSLTPKYDSIECDKQFDRIQSHYASNNQYTLGTLMQLFKEAEANVKH